MKLVNCYRAATVLVAICAGVGFAQDISELRETLKSPQSSGQTAKTAEIETYYVYWPLSYSETASVKATALIAPEPANDKDGKSKAPDSAIMPEAAKRFDGLG